MAISKSGQWGGPSYQLELSLRNSSPKLSYSNVVTTLAIARQLGCIFCSSVDVPIKISQCQLRRPRRDVLAQEQSRAPEQIPLCPLLPA